MSCLLGIRKSNEHCLIESGLRLLAKEYEKNPSYGHTCMHDNMVPLALRALGTKTQTSTDSIEK